MVIFPRFQLTEVPELRQSSQQHRVHLQVASTSTSYNNRCNDLENISLTKLEHQMFMMTAEVYYQKILPQNAKNPANIV